MHVGEQQMLRCCERAALHKKEDSARGGSGRCAASSSCDGREPGLCRTEHDVRQDHDVKSRIEHCQRGQAGEQEVPGCDRGRAWAPIAARATSAIKRTVRHLATFGIMKSLW